MTSLPLREKRVVITGGASGIGRCIATRLGAAGASVCLIGRSPTKLKSAADELSAAGISVHTITCDFNKDEDVLAVRAEVERLFDLVHILVHSAGVIALAPLAAAAITDFDMQYRINVRAPLLLTQSLLPLIREAQGDIVFINSSVGVRAKEHAGAYAASKHALRALADTLRMEVNTSGVRVLSVFPGNTATEMQQQVCRELGKDFLPETMLQPDDVAAAVVSALMLPATAELTDLHLRPAHP